MDKYKVAIVDDDEVALENLSFELGKDARFFLKGTARNGKQGKKLIAKVQPDLLFLDLICPWYIRACVVLRGGLIRRSFILRLTRTGYARLINPWCWLIVGLFVQVWSMPPGESRIWLSASLILEC